MQGPYTKEDGYMGYFEVCQWETSINPDIQSAVATRYDSRGLLWVGYETVESAEIKLRFMLKMGLAGTMWWALDLDDFYNGAFCGKGN